MRRVLLVAAILSPAAVRAVEATTSGQLLEMNDFSTRNGVSYINQGHCSGAPASLDWIETLTSVTGIPVNSTYKIFAADTAPTTSGGGTFCAETGTTTPLTFAGQVAGFSADQVHQSGGVDATLIMSTVHVACDSSSEGKAIYVCSHLYDNSASRVGWSWGKFLIQTIAPNPATNVSVSPGDTRLMVAWDASDVGTRIAADHYVALASTVLGGPTVSSAETTSQEATLRDLVNGTGYYVVVKSYSVGGNPDSGPDPAAIGTPQPVNDFWDEYKNVYGGREAGGCASGPSGALGFLAAASLVLLRRRK